MQATLPIGVFDSGVGGLTVLHALTDLLPHESVLYLGDTARVPYGTKSAAVVEAYALRCAGFLVNQGAKAIVIACNTASAVAGGSALPTDIFVRARAKHGINPQIEVLVML